MFARWNDITDKTLRYCYHKPIDMDYFNVFLNEILKQTCLQET